MADGWRKRRRRTCTVWRRPDCRIVLHHQHPGRYEVYRGRAVLPAGARGCLAHAVDLANQLELPFPQPITPEVPCHRP